MFQAFFFKFAPPRVVAAFLHYALPAFFVLRWLLQSVYGLLLLSVMLYWLTGVFSETQPLTASGLALWIDDLPVEAKAATLAIVMTVTGFLVAFHTASASWKSQARAKMQLDAAEDIEEFFNEFLTKTVQLQLAAEGLLKAAKAVQQKGLVRDTTFALKYALARTEESRKARDRLAEMSSEMNRLQGRHGSMLMSLGAGVNLLADCISSAQMITNAMWIYLPLPPEKDEHLSFIAQEIDEDEYEEFFAKCDTYYPVVAGLMGGLRGLLLTPMTEFNLSWMVNMKRLAPQAEEGFSAIRRAKQTLADSQQ